MGKIIPLLLLLSFLALGEEITLLSFESAAFKDWRANQSISDLKVEGKYLTGKCVGSDPQIFSPLFEIKANNRQVVEIKMKSDRDGLAQLFWSGTLEEPYGGFRPEKVNDFYVKGDNLLHVYRLLPFWGGEEKIIHLRLDPPDGAYFQIEYIKIKEIQPTPEGQWLIFGGLNVKKSTDKALTFQITSKEANLLLPVPPFKGTEAPLLSFRLRLKSSNPNGFGEIVFQEGKERRSYAFDLIMDGKPHFYNLFPGWFGDVSSVMLLLRNCMGEGEIGDVNVGVTPKGEEIHIKYFGVDGIARAGKPFPLILQLENKGTTIENVQVELQLPKELKLQKGKPSVRIAKFSFGDTEFLSWDVVCEKAGEYKVGAKISFAQNRQELSSVLKITKLPPLSPSDYPPEPKVTPSDWEIGVYYFPGWPSASNWLPVKNWGRKPLLGFYKEGEPYVMDWQIKWALEHGITFFIFDWYWVQGSRMLEHALHNGFLKSRYGKLMKFSLLWANHNPPKTSSIPDLINLTRFCIDNYFHLPNYLKIDGKPTLFIFTPRQLTNDLGVEGVKEGFEKMRELCRQEGLNGLFIIGCMHDSDWDLRIMKEEGYDAVTGYNYPWAGAGPTDKRASYEDMINGFARIWQGIADKGYDLIVPTSPGWDPRPWHGQNTLVRTNSTPSLFEKHLREAKDFVEKRGLRKIVVIEAWNEWGEGSYIEPSREWGFAYLDAVRDVFLGKGEHLDLVPQDIGLPLVEAESPPPRDSWDFEEGLEGWSAMMGIGEFKVENGCLILKTSTNDPAINLPPVMLDAKDYGKIIIRMKVDKGSGGQVFWATNVFPISEFTSQRFRLIADNQFHIYELDLTTNPAWMGKITQIRFDPTDSAGANVEIDYIKLIKK
ncbi:glycoside hydrolase family 99-like domain-containing protein [bacterium]|nr:glycoside hydrolase family 99-like domain-containing protein [bacterium]